MDTEQMKIKMAETVRSFNAKGWSPATSTNYSFLDHDKLIWVSRSGIDKAEFTENDFITVDSKGQATGEYKSARPSAETLIHCEIYSLFPEARVILHSHSVYPVMLSLTVNDSIQFSGFEIQKGFEGEDSHQAIVEIPVLENSQDMIEFSSFIKNAHNRIYHHSFIIRGHGTYAWGRNIFEAKRHLETLEYLCMAQFLMKSDNQ